MITIAHRGASSEAPENTLTAFRKAIAAGADLIEFDVRLSRDGVPVVFHDRLLDRTTDGAGPLADLTLAQLKELDAGSWFSPENAGEKIPALDEVLKLSAPTPVGLYIELKLDRGEEAVREELVRGVVSILAAERFPRALLASFDWECLHASRRLAPERPTGLIFREARFWEEAAAAGYRSIEALCARGSIVTSTEVGRAHRAGRKVFAWTIDREEELKPMLDCGVDGIASNNPRWLIGALGKSR